MLFNKQYTLLIVGAVTAFTSAAQSRFSGWSSLNTRITLAKKIIFQNDISIRSTEKWIHRQNILVRSGINIRFNNHWTTGIGYSFVNSRQTISDYTCYTPEHQFYEQVLFNHSLKSGTGSHSKQSNLLHRMMPEERFIPTIFLQGNTLKKNGNSFATRFRYLLRDVTPFRSGNKAFEKGAYFALQDELLLNITGQSKLNGKLFDQNRIFLATGYRFTKNIDIEAGYMYRYIAGVDHTTVHDNVLQLISFIRL